MPSMPFDKVLQRLDDIRDNIELSRTFIAGMDFAAFSADLKTIYATIRALEIISEASRHLPQALKDRHPEIDWIGVRDSGNIYRHAYEFVTDERLWDTLTKHLDILHAAVQSELERSA
jgi:uncharacterized protein with HEPN domain